MQFCLGCPKVVNSLLSYLEKGLGEIWPQNQQLQVCLFFLVKIVNFVKLLRRGFLPYIYLLKYTSGLMENKTENLIQVALKDTIEAISYSIHGQKLHFFQRRGASICIHKKLEKKKWYKDRATFLYAYKRAFWQAGK